MLCTLHVARSCQTVADVAPSPVVRMSRMQTVPVGMGRKGTHPAVKHYTELSRERRTQATQPPTTQPVPFTSLRYRGSS